MAGKMNPRIRKVDVGVRELKSIQIYPLSIKDQTNLVEFFTSLMDKFFGEMRDKQFSNAEFFSYIAETITENIPEFMKFVTEEDVDIDNLTNHQLSEIIKIVYTDNFEEPGKNIQGLLTNLKGVMFPGMKTE